MLSGAMAGLFVALAVVLSVVAPISGGSSGSKPAPDATVWLCRPGLTVDPCLQSRAATAVSSTGAATSIPSTVGDASRFDCFYVYPTVSEEPLDNSDLQIERSETRVASLQASRFSQTCDVWAPMYRQSTLQSFGHGDPRVMAIAYQSLLAGWHEYLGHHNSGRPIILIGDSQGASILIRLIHEEFDPNPQLRARLVSALILGGNVKVPVGHSVGGSFATFPTCAARAQTGCVIAYSPFPSEPPTDATYGRVDQGGAGTLTVACTNPADLGGGNAPLDPYFSPSTFPGSALAVTTPWVTFPGLYRAHCENADGASW
ncbi:MAG: DUF3089 domain-containing protein, partial [Pseudonocardiaceae bacterium]